MYNWDMKTRIPIVLLLAVAIAAAIAFLFVRGGGEHEDGAPADVRIAADGRKAPPRKAKKHGSAEAIRGKPADVKQAGAERADAVQLKEGDDEEQEEAVPEDPAEKQVEAFDSLTDKWMEPAKGGVSMKDVDAFVAQFRNVPKDRKDECLHRALNLVPDENVMLLAGILMDKSQDKELIELVFNDVLNRDEGVKKPILQQIFKDKDHPCWADTAWILDVTGELPKKGK